jgi:hypothetical protein
MTTQTLEPDALFLAELKSGHQWQLWAALQFLKHGLAVQVPELKVRPSQDDINDYTDTGDVIVLLPVRNAIFEVKSRDITFTSSRDYPYTTAFVDRVKTWERKKDNRPTGILLVSQLTGAIVGVPSNSQARWTIETRHDNVRDYDRDYYMADKSLLYDFDDIVAILKRR